jgi:hypothetical protein
MRLIERLSTAAALLACTTTTWAHDGHGMAGSHWHATDTAGFALVAALAALAIWLSRGDE